MIELVEIFLTYQENILIIGIGKRVLVNIGFITFSVNFVSEFHMTNSDYHIEFDSVAVLQFEEKRLIFLCTKVKYFSI